MSFRDAVEGADAPLPDALRRGLQALQARDKGNVRTRSKPAEAWTGSIHVDEALRDERPRETRWDYGIGYVTPEGREHAVWVEVHSADTKHVAEVLAKLGWLKEYLRTSAEALLTMSDRPEGSFFWVARSKVDIRTGSPEERSLVKAGLELPRTVLELP